MWLDVQEVDKWALIEPYRFVYDREEFATWFTHVDEHGTRIRFWSAIKPGDVVIDVGAACGSYTLPALAQGAAHVYAFLPEVQGVNDALTLGLFNASVELNGWRDRVTALPFGLWSSQGWLEVNGKDMPCLRVREDKTGLMPVTTLDSVVADTVKRIDWIKIDVEGGEVEVLYGAQKTLRKFHPHVLVELHTFKDETIPKRVAEAMRHAGHYCDATYQAHAGWVTHAMYRPLDATEAPRPCGVASEVRL